MKIPAICAGGQRSVAPSGRHASVGNFLLGTFGMLAHIAELAAAFALIVRPPADTARPALAFAAAALLGAAVTAVGADLLSQRILTSNRRVSLAALYSVSQVSIRLFCLTCKKVLFEANNAFVTRVVITCIWQVQCLDTPPNRAQ